MKRLSLLIPVALLAGAAFAPAQERFDDVVRNLRNPDPKARLASVRLLRDAKYPEAIAPMAPLVNDPIDDIQLEALAAELSFYLVDEVQPRKRVALVVEVRNQGRAAAAFDRGPLAVWPRPVPAELVAALLKAVDDDNTRVRLESIYTLGTIARGPLAGEHAQLLVKALDHYDPVIRAAAARVLGRLQVKTAGDALIKAINDSQAPVRYASMRALGEIRDERAVTALTEQFTFYGKGEGAWSALDALARIAHASSVPLFKARLADKDHYLRRAAAEGLARAGDTSEMSALEAGAGNDPSEMARAAMAFALQKLGRPYLPRLAGMMNSGKVAPQVAAYFLELGPAIAPQLLPHLQDPGEAIRANVAVILGELGDGSTIPALEPLTRDRDRDVIEAATRAIERIKMRG
jgi:HEAT repeat protein